MRADRLISIMILLQNNLKMTSKELASEFEVSERGKTGGWRRLMDHFRSQLSGLKLLASLPSSTKTEARHYLEKIYIDTGTWKPSNKITER